MAKVSKRLATDEGLQKIVDALNNTEAVQQAKAEIQAEGATQVTNVQAAAEEITGKVEQIGQNTQDVAGLKEDIKLLNDGYKAISLVDGYYVKQDGRFTSLSGWSRTVFISCKGVNKIYIFTPHCEYSMYNAFYSEEDESTFLKNFSTKSGDWIEIEVPEGANYFALSNETVVMQNTKVKSELDLRVSALEANGVIYDEIVDNFHDLTSIEETFTPSILFNNSYIDINTKKIETFSNWAVLRLYLNKGERLLTTIGGVGCCLATCDDEEPTTSSTFNIVFSTNVRPYNVDYVAEDDITIYLSSATMYIGVCTVNTKNIININHLDKRIDNVNAKVDAISTNKTSGTGYSLNYNNALKNIESFQYTDAINPWIATENEDNFEEYGTYIDNKISSIPDGNSFIWITDVHYTGNKKRSGALIDYVRRKANIKTILHGGDVQNERPLAIDAAKDWLDFNKDYVGRMGSDFKQVCGDHDHNGQYWGKEALREQYGLTDPSKTFFTCKFVQKVLTGYCENEIVYDTVYDKAISEYGWSEADLKEYNAFKKMHYYFDDDKAKTRFIVLFTGWSWTDYGFPYNKLGKATPFTVQAEFLYNALISATNGYNIIVCGHDTIINPLLEVVDGKQYYDTSETVYNNNGWKNVTYMLAGLRSKSTVNVQVSDWSVAYSSITDVPYKSFDFTDAPDVNLIATIGGDVHWDILSKATITQIETIETLNSGDMIDKSVDIPHIVTMTDGGDRGYCDYTTKEVICSPATKGTINEQAFDVVTINKNGIYLTRIGSGNDRKLLFTNE